MSRHVLILTEVPADATTLPWLPNTAVVSAFDCADFQEFLVRLRLAAEVVYASVAGVTP